MLKRCDNSIPPELQLVILYNENTDNFELGQYHKGHWYDPRGDAYHNISDWIVFTHWCELPSTYEILIKRKEHDKETEKL